LRLLSLVVVCLAVVFSSLRAEAAPHVSPMTPARVARMREVLARSSGRRDVFVKVGDSHTHAPTFLGCFAGGDVKLGDRPELAATVAHFEKRSFNRKSLAATPGWMSAQLLRGSPSPLDREIAAVNPAFALITIGTNDNTPSAVAAFEANFSAIVQKSLALGVVPIVSTVPARNDGAGKDARVLEINAAILRVADRELVPWIDLHAALAALPKRGLTKDGVHLEVAGRGSPHACWFGAQELRMGVNRRNLLVLEALELVRQHLVDAPAAAPERIAGLELFYPRPAADHSIML